MQAANDQRALGHESHRRQVAEPPGQCAAQCHRGIYAAEGAEDEERVVPVASCQHRHMVVGDDGGGDGGGTGHECHPRRGHQARHAAHHHAEQVERHACQRWIELKRQGQRDETIIYPADCHQHREQDETAVPHAAPDEPEDILHHKQRHHKPQRHRLHHLFAIAEDRGRQRTPPRRRAARIVAHVPAYDEPEGIRQQGQRDVGHHQRLEPAPQERQVAGIFFIREKVTRQEEKRRDEKGADGVIYGLAHRYVRQSDQIDEQHLGIIHPHDTFIHGHKRRY